MRKSLSDESLSKIKRRSSLGSEPFPERSNPESEWVLLVLIPKEVLEIEQNISLNDVELKGNIYKCGDELTCPHWISLFPIVTDRPAFHKPEYFQPLI